MEKKTKTKIKTTAITAVKEMRNVKTLFSFLQFFTLSNMMGCYLATEVFKIQFRLTLLGIMAMFLAISYISSDVLI